MCGSEAGATACAEGDSGPSTDDMGRPRTRQELAAGRARGHQAREPVWAARGPCFAFGPLMGVHRAAGTERWLLITVRLGWEQLLAGGDGVIPRSKRRMEGCVSV